MPFAYSCLESKKMKKYIYVVGPAAVLILLLKLKCHCVILDEWVFQLCKNAFKSEKGKG